MRKICIKIMYCGTVYHTISKSRKRQNKRDWKSGNVPSPPLHEGLYRGTACMHTPSSHAAGTRKRERTREQFYVDVCDKTMQ